MLLALLAVDRIEAVFAAQFAELSVRVGAVVVAAEATLHEEGTKRAGVIRWNPNFGLDFYPVGIDDICVGLGRTAEV